MKFSRCCKMLAAAAVMGCFADPAWAQTNLVSNPSFEANTYTSFPGYHSQAGNGAITDWSGTRNYGLNPAEGASAFANNGATPHGDQVAFLQNDGSSIGQTISGLTIGESYELRFHYNAREDFETPVLRVTLDDFAVHHAPVCPVGDTNRYRLSVSTFVAEEKRVSVRFEQVASGDATVLIDNIELRSVPSGAVPPFTTTDAIRKVHATPNEIVLSVTAPPGENLKICELPPYGSKNDAATGNRASEFIASSDSTISLPRFDCGRDRLYSGFIGIEPNELNTTNHAGDIKYVEEFAGISAYEEPFPTALSKKGLQVQMRDDALALGIEHAAINLNLPRLIDLDHQPGNPTWEMDGDIYSFNQTYLDALRVKTLSDAGVVISFIVIYTPNVGSPLDAMMAHPRYDEAGILAALNTLSVDGVRHLKATMEFLADYYSRPDRSNGRVVNYIIGNEVNVHWYWYNMGPTTFETFTEEYLRTMRIANAAVRKISSESRVYVSLDNHWNAIHQGDEEKGFPARAFIDRFTSRGRAGGDFEWHVAYHPYPENMYEPRTWLDSNATAHVLTSPRMTFKNIELLPHYLSREELLYRGTPRRVILSEQGFHADYNETSERRQAAAYCYAYYKTAHLPGIDSFILHRHVDHAGEGGLNLGLWRRSTDSISDPDIPKPIYSVFRDADTADWESAFGFAMAEIGITDWDQLITWSVFEDWRREHFTATELSNPALSGPDADPDGDGLANAIEFAFNYNPRGADDRQLLQPSVTNDGGRPYLLLSYRERLGTSGLDVSVQASRDLLEWSEEGIETRELSRESITRTMEARIPVEGASRLFLRAVFAWQEDLFEKHVAD